MQEKQYTTIRQMYRTVGTLLRDIAEIIGEVTDSWTRLEMGEMIMPGLGLVQEATHLINCIRYLQQGPCKIYVLGACNSGKSTLINSLLGTSLLPVSHHPTTAVVTHITYGPQQQALIYEEGKDKLAPISWPAFTRDFILPWDSSGITNAQGKIVSPWQHVKYMLVEAPHALPEYGVRLIDTPGLNVHLSHPVVTPYMLKRLDTLIIVVLNALHPFPDEVQALLTTLQDTSLPEKVFFVVNRFDQVPLPKVDALELHIESTLRSSFVDQQGNFNGKLYQQRVFFVSARDSLHARIASADTGLQVESSGITELESAITDYLLTEDVRVQSLEPTLRILDSIGKQAYQQITQQRSCPGSDKG